MTKSLTILLLGTAILCACEPVESTSYGAQDAQAQSAMNDAMKGVDASELAVLEP